MRYLYSLMTLALLVACASTEPPTGDLRPTTADEQSVFEQLAGWPSGTVAATLYDAGYRPLAISSSLPSSGQGWVLFVHCPSSQARSACLDQTPATTAPRIAMSVRANPIAGQPGYELLPSLRVEASLGIEAGHSVIFSCQPTGWFTLDAVSIVRLERLFTVDVAGTRLVDLGDGSSDGSQPVNWRCVELSAAH